MADEKERVWCGVGFMHFPSFGWDYDEDGEPPKDYQSPGISPFDVSKDSRFFLPKGVAGGVYIDGTPGGPYADPKNPAHKQYRLNPGDEIVAIIEQGTVADLKTGSNIRRYSTRDGQNQDRFRADSGSPITMELSDGRLIKAMRRAFIKNPADEIVHDPSERGKECRPKIVYAPQDHSQMLAALKGDLSPNLTAAILEASKRSI